MNSKTDLQKDEEVKEKVIEIDNWDQEDNKIVILSSDDNHSFWSENPIKDQKLNEAEPIQITNNSFAPFDFEQYTGLRLSLVELESGRLALEYRHVWS